MPIKNNFNQDCLISEFSFQQQHNYKSGAEKKSNYRGFLHCKPWPRNMSPRTDHAMNYSYCKHNNLTGAEASAPAWLYTLLASLKILSIVILAYLLRYTLLQIHTIATLQISFELLLPELKTQAFSLSGGNICPRCCFQPFDRSMNTLQKSALTLILQTPCCMGSVS